MKNSRPVLKTFTCAYCNETHAENELGGICPVCGQLFCKKCYEANKLDDHVLEHDYD